MRVVHFADCHLGFRQFDRLTAGGMNLREADVARTFVALVDSVIALRPDIVLVAGDVFHSEKPTNAAIVHAFRQFQRIRQALPETPIVMISGNHDAPKASESGGILPLFSSIGIHVADRRVERFDFPSLDLSIQAVPEAPGVERGGLLPDPARRFNVLLLHGQIDGFSYGARGTIPLDELNADQWDYVALGDFHVYTQLAENVCYPGAIDYTTTNLWGERADEATRGIAGKGFVLRDLETREHVFVDLPATRRFVTLPPIDASELTAEQVDRAFSAAIDGQPIDDSIVRLVVSEIAAETQRALDWKLIRRARHRALNLGITWHAPERADATAIRERIARKSLSLGAILTQFLEARAIAPGVDRAELLQRATLYLEETSDANAPLETLLEQSLTAATKVAAKENAA